MRKGKRWTALLLALVLCLSVLPAGVLASEMGAAEVVSPSVMAVTSGKCGKNVTWKLDSKGTLTISGKGAMKNWNSNEYVPWYSARGSIKKVVIKNGVTSIGDSAFEDCGKLTKVEIANSVTKVGHFAFAGCSRIKRIKIPNKVTDMGSYTFSGCEKLEEISIPDGVIGIGMATFSNCSQLKNIKLPKSAKYIGRGAFCECIHLKQIVFPSRIKTIAMEAFYGCSNLKKIYFAGNAPDIDNSTWADFEEVAFGRVTATAYYPKGNKTWTSDKLQNYGGKLTWKTWSPNQPKGVSLVSVTNQKGKKLKVTWKKNAAATGYEVQYSTSSKFKSAKKVKIKKAATASTTVSKLTKGKKYYVRIRTYKTVSGKTYYSGWSKVKTAVIKK